MHGAMEKRLGLNLSFVMTFFFNMLYLQYHMTEIADRADAAGSVCSCEGFVIVLSTSLNSDLTGRISNRYDLRAE